MENRRLIVLHQMWMAGDTCEAIGRRFGVAASTISKWAKDYKLPARPKPMPEHRIDDPSPEEIERLKAELKARHMEERRAESDGAVRSKVSLWRRGSYGPQGGRV